MASESSMILGGITTSEPGEILTFESSELGGNHVSGEKPPMETYPVFEKIKRGGVILVKGIKRGTCN